MNKPPLQIDDSLVFQQEKPEMISIESMNDEKNENKYERINMVLQATNYKELMEKFVNSASQTTLVLNVNQDVHDALDCFTFQEVQDAIKNIYNAKEYKKDEYILWIYEKYNTASFFMFRKERLWLRIVFGIWILCGCIFFGVYRPCSYPS